MKTKKELEKLSRAIGKAIFAYHNAIAVNLKECGKEMNVLPFDGDEDEKGLRLELVGRHNDLISTVIDKVRWNDEHNIVEVHIVEEDYDESDYWLDISYLGDNEDYVNDNIDWEK